MGEHDRGTAGTATADRAVNGRATTLVNGRFAGETHPRLTDLMNVLKGIADRSALDFFRVAAANDRGLFSLLHPFGYRGSRATPKAAVDDFYVAYRNYVAAAQSADPRGGPRADIDRDRLAQQELANFLRGINALRASVLGTATMLARRTQTNDLGELADAAGQGKAVEGFVMTMGGIAAGLRVRARAGGKGGGGAEATSPEVAAGFRPQDVKPLANLTGKPLTDPRIGVLGRIWRQVTKPGEAATLNAGNSRAAFDSQRDRFWRAVRKDPQARQLFIDAGCVFPPPNPSRPNATPSTAPVYVLRDGQRIKMSIDHIAERQSAPQNALNEANLRVVFLLENTVVLQKINQMDPFQSQ